MSQGYSVAKFAPFWEVVECKTEGKGKVQHIVVDTSPRLTSGLPVKVYGPDTKGKCMEWARSEALFYLTVKGTFVTD